MDIFTRLGPDNIAMMLAALTAEGGKRTSSLMPDIAKQKWTIIKYADSMSIKSKEAICNIIIRSGGKDELIEANNSRLIVNLDNLHSQIIEQLYIFIVCKNEL